MVRRMNVAARRRIPTGLTVQEFLDWAERMPGKWGLVDGEPVAMAPASAIHGTIQARLATALNNHLDAARRDCVAVVEPAVVPRRGAAGNMRVPDVAVTCAPVPGGVPLPDPVAIFEVLSPSNEADTRAAVGDYASIPSVAAIVLIHSTRIRAEIFRRGADGSWPPEQDTVEADGVLALDVLGFTFPLAALYRGTLLGASRSAP